MGFLKNRFHFLEYTYRWLEVNNVNGFLRSPSAVCWAMPGNHGAGDRGTMNTQTFYQINKRVRPVPWDLGRGGGDSKHCGGRAPSETAGRQSRSFRSRRRTKEVLIGDGVSFPERWWFGSFQPYVGA